MPRSGARLPAASLTFGMTCTAIPRHARTRNHKSAPRAKVSLCDSIRLTTITLQHFDAGAGELWAKVGDGMMG
jgi:hypothetical protein